jgi:hypothetical protein
LVGAVLSFLTCSAAALNSVDMISVIAAASFGDGDGWDVAGSEGEGKRRGRGKGGEGKGREGKVGHWPRTLFCREILFDVTSDDRTTCTYLCGHRTRCVT